ncbi:MAG: exonuclease domain-containing protein [Candidatus Peregrinibacteria bacterium]|nr:exonuclease domain-containing protein [Candidatus Peregrinibacteria bacterium]MDZ4245298.1 exonuclease domain-containing protein [Candidatus Gracilibacteria bacterium]
MKFIALDLETTGLDANNDTIIEFAAIVFEDDKIIKELQMLINPLRPIPSIATNITGITDEMVSTAKPFEDYKEEIQNFIGDLPILGQNISFDIGFLKTHGIELTNEQLDTFTLARAIIPKAQSYSLEILTENFNIEHAGAHRAYDDVVASVKLMEKLRLLLLKESDETLEKIKTLLGKYTWSWKEFFLNSIEQKKLYESQLKDIDDCSFIMDEHGEPHKKEVTPDHTIPLEGKKITEGFIDPEKYDFSEKTLVAMPGTRAFYFPKNTFKLKYNYLLPEEFEKLLNKNIKLNEDEVTTCIKLIIWFSKTKTFETTELSLYNKEYSIVNRINLDEHRTHEIYDKKLQELEKLNKIYISHSNLLKLATLNLDLGLEIKNLVVLDAIEFEKSLAKNMTVSIGVGDCEGEGEMLFGLLGIIFEKFKPNDLSFPEITVDESIKQSQEWKNAEMTAMKIIEGFMPHIPPKLRLLKEALEERDKFNVSLMNPSEGDVLIRITSRDILQMLDEKIWQKFDNIIINDDIVEVDNNKFLKQALKLEGFETKKINEKNEIEFTSFPDMSDSKSKDFPVEVAEKVKEILNKFKNVVIVFSSNGPISHFMEKINEKLELDHDSTSINVFGQGVSGSNGKIINKIQADGSNIILANFDFALELIEIFKEKNINDIALVFVKLPFMHPNNLYMKYVESFYSASYDAYTKYSLPKAKCQILKMIRRYKSSFEDTHGYVLDSKIQKR